MSSIKVSSCLKPFILILAVFLMRIIPHPPQFSPLLSVGLFSGFAMCSLPLAISSTIFGLFLSDLLIGFYPGMVTIYGAVILSVCIGRLVSNAQSFFVANVAATLVFFLITNLSAWYVLPTYPKTAFGMTQTLIAGIPFYPMTLLSTFFFSILLFQWNSLFQLDDAVTAES